jgi:fatty acid amide hydrolase 2
MIVTAVPRKITERSAVELASAIRDGELSATQVVGAHIAVHRERGHEINAVIASRYDAALEDAAAADRAIAAAADAGELPPLLGVPFTVKESIAVRGMPNSAGLVARREYRCSESAPAVQRLVDAGAIPLGVTNTSELTLWIESANPLYGRTSNPYHKSRTAGGSSGGEGAAVGCGGSPFGLASDIAGSIRIPALFCGVFGHKPSAGLVPNTGLWPPSVGASGRMLGTGPIARRAQDLMPLLRVIAGPDGLDAYATETALGDPAAVALEGLAVVTVEDSSLVPISRELRDARERAAGALAAAGASIRRVELRSWRQALLPFLATLQAGSEGDHPTFGLLETAGEPRPTWRTLLRGGAAHSLPTRLALAAELLPEPGDSAARERLLAAGRSIASELIDAIGDGVLLHPAHARVAPRHGRTVGRMWLVTPAAVFNLAGVPVTEVPLGLSERGLPVGVQVAAGPGRDHVSIAIALELERVFGGWVPPA